MSKKQPSFFTRYTAAMPKTGKAMLAQYRAAKDLAERVKLIGYVIKGSNVIRESRSSTPEQKRHVIKLVETLLLAVTTEAHAVRNPHFDNHWELPRDLADAWVWFGWNPSVRFAKRLEQFAKSRDVNLRGLALRLLGKMGFDRSLPVLLQAARNPDARICANVASGASESADEGYSSDRFRAAMLDALTPYITDERRMRAHKDADWAEHELAQTIWTLDPAKGLALLTSGRCLHAGNPMLMAIVLVIKHSRPKRGFFKEPKRKTAKGPVRIRTRYVPPEPAVVWPLYEKLLAKAKKRPDDQRTTYVLFDLLELISELDPPRVLEAVQAMGKALPEAGSNWILKDIVKKATRAQKRSTGRSRT